ncbi:MAG: Tm-1-like ATP-binding domain-containing protein [Desulfitobacterium hafniense]|nr:Tm-1-like ATP-binding domain-containing protein [Desulfitobacterium hafniense]
MTAKSIAVIVTIDTKEAETFFLHDFISSHGWNAIVLDVSTRNPHSFAAAFPRDQVSLRGGVPFQELGTLRRDEIMRTMGLGAANILQELHAKGELGGVLAIGGNQGTAIAAIAMRALPTGVPKLIVSTVASGNVRPYVEYKDITMMFSVADLLGGANTVSRTILSNAAGAVMGMATYGLPMKAGNKPVIATTAFGNTDAAVSAASKILVEQGFEVIPFHASGACGSAMEELIENGLIHGVLDLTTHELIGEVFGLDIYTPLRPRLEAAGKKGIPQVVVPGALEYFCFGPPESIPPSFRGRMTHYHNPYNTNVKATAEELTVVGRALAKKLNKSLGPVTVLIPAKGWSENGRLGGSLYDPVVDEALVNALEAALNPEIKLIKIDANINDPIFAETAAKTMQELMKQVYKTC